MNNWISVKDRLPAIGQQVLVYGSDDIDWVNKPSYAVAEFDGESLYVSADGKNNLLAWNILDVPAECCYMSIFGVTHWMALPEHPTKDI